MYLTLAPTFVLPESLPLCFACTDVRSLLSRILDLSSLVNVHAILLSRSMYDVICSLSPLSLFLTRCVTLSLSHTRDVLPPARPCCNSLLLLNGSCVPACLRSNPLDVRQRDMFALAALAHCPRSRTPAAHCPRSRTPAALPLTRPLAHSLCLTHCPRSRPPARIVDLSCCLTRVVYLRAIASPATQCSRAHPASVAVYWYSWFLIQELPTD